MSSPLRRQILDLVERLYQEEHHHKEFIPGQTKISYSGRVYDADEMTGAVDACLDFMLTAGRFANEFEREARRYFSANRFLLVNSGSSANLVMVSSLKSATMERPLRDGDEIITPATTFPTTLAPIVQNRLTPVFVDCEDGTLNMDPTLVEAALSDRTRAVFVPHTLGYPCHMDFYRELCARHRLYLLEDCCDALGATYDGQLAGSFGQMASLSFYPAHQITMGEGGGVIINDKEFVRSATSIRDWGRDCWCEPGQNNTCGKRFERRMGDLPQGYDHKYIYSHIGYNLKVTDMQAAIGAAQWKKLPQFVDARRRHFQRYFDALQPLQEHLELVTPNPRSNPSWFGFPITVKPHIQRRELIKYLEAVNIETRLMFGGNIVKQPAYRNINCRIAGRLDISNKIMERTFFVGVYPGLTDAMQDFVIERLFEYFRNQDLAN